MANYILSGLVGCLLAGIVAYQYSRIVYWRTSTHDAEDQSSDMNERALVSENEKARAEETSKLLWSAMMNQREATVRITDQQLMALGQMITANLVPKEEMN